MRTLIIEETQKAFQSKHFTQIDQETLISLLSLDELNIDEIDLLAAVSQWVDTEVQRQGLLVSSANRRKVFEPIKGYVLFRALPYEKIASCRQIVELFASEEIAQLHLLDKDKDYSLAVELKTPRKDRTGVRSVFVRRDFIDGCNYSSLGELHLGVNQLINVHTIYLTLSESTPNLSLEIRDSTDFDLKIESSVKWGRRCFSFNPPVDLQPDIKYTLAVTFDGLISDQERFTYQKKLNYNYSVIFYLNYPKDDCFSHFIRGFDFSLPV